MIDEASGQAIGLIDLDTVKPGLIHYDIGDCVRSCCNPAGEETLCLDDVSFDMELCEAILTGYLSVAGCLLYTSPSPRDGLLSRMPSSA